LVIKQLMIMIYQCLCSKNSTICPKIEIQPKLGRKHDGDKIWKIWWSFIKMMMNKVLICVLALTAHVKVQKYSMHPMVQKICNIMDIFGTWNLW